MTVRGVDVLRSEGGDGTVGGGSLYGKPDPRFWESYWSGDFASALAHAVAGDRLFPKLWLPGGWAGRYGAYQSQLKALMTMLGQPAGHVRSWKIGEHMALVGPSDHAGFYWVAVWHNSDESADNHHVTARPVHSSVLHITLEVMCFAFARSSG